MLGPSRTAGESRLNPMCRVQQVWCWAIYTQGTIVHRGSSWGRESSSKLTGRYRDLSGQERDEIFTVGCMGTSCPIRNSDLLCQACSRKWHMAPRRQVPPMVWQPNHVRLRFPVKPSSCRLTNCPDPAAPSSSSPGPAPAWKSPL